MKLSKIILEQNCGCGQDPCKTHGIDENLNPEVHKLVNAFLKKMADRYDYSLQDAVYAVIRVLKSQNFDGLSNEALKEENRYSKDGYDEGDIKLMGDMILPTEKMVVLQAEEDTYNRGLLVTSKEDKSYDVAYWADDKTKPYPIGVEIDGKEVTKEAKIIKFLFHPEMK